MIRARKDLFVKDKKMKKIREVALAAFMAVSLAACSGGGEKQPEEKKEIKVGFVTDTGGINDKSFNQTSYEGIKDFYEEMKYQEDLKYIESKADADYIPNLSTFADDQADLIVAAGFKFDKAIAALADSYPNQKLLVIDVGSLDTEKYPNVKQVVFSEHEGAFLVGVVAALKAQELGEKSVGYVTGSDSTTMLKFYAGYQAGVWAVDPSMTILFDNANSFNDIALGKTLAEKQFAQCSIIFHAAGGVGNGVIEAAKEATLAGKEKWVIGVDCDQYEQGFYDETKTKSVILTSMMKRVDIAAYDTCKEVAEGKFKGGLFTYSLSNNGVGLPDENPNLSEAMLEKVNELKKKVLDGEMTIRDVPLTHTENPNTTFVGSSK